MVNGPIKKYKTAESMHKAIQRVNRADTAVRMAADSNNKENYKYAKKVKKYADKKLAEATDRASKRRSSSKKYENQK